MDVPGIDERRRPGCPKRMVYGPCGGVRPDGACEVGRAGDCVFLGPAPPPWTGPPVGRPIAGILTVAPAPVVVTDLHARPRDAASLRRVAEVLQGTCDAVLVADHGARHDDFPASYVAGLVVSWGLDPWVTLSCRDRNRAALAADCAALADMGVAGVHCVTGDWQPTGETQVFDLDALRLVELAAGHGRADSVAATPGAPPGRVRPARLAEKASAGATACFVNHCGGPAAVASFVEQAQAAGADLAYVPCVPVISDARSAAALAALPGLVLDRAVVDEVDASVGTPDAGVRAAAAEASAMLAIPGVRGVNLSGAASMRSEEISAAMMAGLGRLVRQEGARDGRR